MNTPNTLGEKFASTITTQSLLSRRESFLYRVYNILNPILLFGIAVSFLWWLFIARDLIAVSVQVLGLGLFALWVWVGLRRRRLFLKQKEGFSKKDNFLLVNDRQKFMYDLQLDAKTAVLDGSNIYHFGHAQELDAKPLGLLAYQLRQEGHRIVCFFDANIFYTLQEHGAFDKGEKHAIALLQDIFGLRQDEIYVVPSGMQADIYVLETMRHLTNSFAVTNDQYRDYAKKYPRVMKGQWRKGVILSKGQIKLLQHKLKTPIWVD